MKAPPAFQFYPADFMTGTSRFTAEDVGGYILLLCEQWHTGSVPGDDEPALARILRCGRRKARTIWAHIRHKFQREESGVWLNARLEDERQRQSDFREKQRDRGTSGAKKYWDHVKIAEAKVLRKVTDSGANGNSVDSAGYIPAIAQASPDDSSSSSSSSSVRTKNPPKGSQREPKGFRRGRQRQPLPDPWQQQERMAEMRRLMVDGLSYRDALRKAFG